METALENLYRVYFDTVTVKINRWYMVISV
jgi:hypothetical protein